MMDCTDRHFRVLNAADHSPQPSSNTEMVGAQRPLHQTARRDSLLEFPTPAEAPSPFAGLAVDDPRLLARSGPTGKRPWGYDEDQPERGLPSERVQRGASAAC